MGQAVPSPLSKRAQRYAMVVSGVLGKKNIQVQYRESTRGARHVTLGWRLANPLHLNDARGVANSIALAAGCPNVIAKIPSHAPGILSYQFELPESYWRVYNRSHVTGLGVGLGDGERQIEYHLDPPHSLVAGATGCGKSTMIASMLYSLCSTHPPDHMKMLVIDPDHDYTEFDGIPHLAAPIVHGNQPDEIDTILNLFSAELAHRNEQNIKDGVPWLLVVDEAQVAIMQHQRRTEIITNLAERGRKFKMHLVLGVQKPEVGMLNKALGNIANRWVGQVASAQIAVYITGRGGTDCHKLTGKGDFLHITGHDEERFQAALVQSADYDRLPRTETPSLDRVLADHQVAHANQGVERLANLPPLPPEDTSGKQGGRPRAQVDPGMVAHYLKYGDRISQTSAREQYGLTRTAHELHRDFCSALRRAMSQLDLKVFDATVAQEQAPASTAH